MILKKPVLAKKKVVLEKKKTFGLIQSELKIFKNKKEEILVTQINIYKCIICNIRKI